MEERFEKIINLMTNTMEDKFEKIINLKTSDEDKIEIMWGYCMDMGSEKGGLMSIKRVPMLTKGIIQWKNQLLQANNEKWEKQVSAKNAHTDTRFEKFWLEVDKHGISKRERFIEPLLVHIKELMPDSDQEVDIEDTMIKFVNQLLKANDKAWRERVKDLPKRKFPIAKRKWCIECASRIKKDLLKGEHEN